MEELKFEKLSDVEVVEEPSEESHVLIVEGGEVKKAPKGAVGGAGGTSLNYENTDFVINAKFGSTDGTSMSYFYEVTFEKGSKEELFTLNDSSLIPSVVIILNHDMYSHPFYCKVSSFTKYYDPEYLTDRIDLGFQYMSFMLTLELFLS